jgi:hypothetical protein
MGETVQIPQKSPLMERNRKRHLKGKAEREAYGKAMEGAARGRRTEYKGRERTQYLGGRSEYFSATPQERKQKSKAPKIIKGDSKTTGSFVKEGYLKVK